MKFLLLLLGSIILLMLMAPIGIITALIMVFVIDSRERYTKLPIYFF